MSNSQATGKSAARQAKVKSTARRTTGKAATRRATGKSATGRATGKSATGKSAAGKSNAVKSNARGAKSASPPETTAPAASAGNHVNLGATGATGERPLVVAMPKGRILDEASALFAQVGYDLSPIFDSSRRLVYDCGPLRLLILRSSDVPTYVSYGAADVGIAGSDVLDEYGHDLYEPLDLGIGACRMIVAERADHPVDTRSQIHICIASKYPRLTRAYLDRTGQTAEVIKLSGAIELAPLTGLADRIVDITQTGETLRQNGLVVVDTITEITSRLVVNPAALKLRPDPISELIDRLAAVLEPATSA